MQRPADAEACVDPQTQHGHLFIVLAVRRDLAALAVVDDGVHAVERLDEGEAFGDLVLDRVPPDKPAPAVMVRRAVSSRSAGVRPRRAADFDPRGEPRPADVVRSCTENSGSTLDARNGAR